MSVVVNILLFIILLISIISIHEFGHYIAAKAFNVYVPEFSIGMGKALYQKKGKETTFSIRMLPIGGYCAIAQDVGTFDENIDVEYKEVEKERTLAGISKWKKIIVLLAGVFMNLLLALVIMSMVYLNIGQVSVSPKPIIKEVLADSPAERAGLLKDDEITKISLDNGYSISPSTFSELSNFFALYESGDVTLNVLRNNENIVIEVTPDVNDGQVSLGISSYEYSIDKVNIINCFKYGGQYLIEMTKLMWTTIIGLFRGVGLNNLSGPVGIYSATSNAVSLGPLYYFVLISVFSLNIGLFNLIPIPALDGGRILLTLIEAIIKKPINKKVEEYIMTASVVLFLLIFIFTTFHDVIKLFN